MNSDAMRRIQQLERLVAKLAGEMQLLRNQRQPAVGLIQPVLVYTTVAIAGRVASGDDYTITYKEAELWDISKLNVSDQATMTEVIGTGYGAVAKTIKLGNPWEAEVPAEEFVLAIPYKTNFLVAAEEC